MRSQVITKRLPAGYSHLYQATLSGVKLDRNLKDAMQWRVSEIRGGMRAIGTDKLAQRLTQFGNNGRWGAIKVNEFSRIIFQSKKPAETDLGAWVSVELECVMADESAVTKFVAWARKSGFSKFITVKNDASITPSNTGGCGDDECDDEDCSGSSREIGKEFVLTFKAGDNTMLNAVCNKLKELGSYVNKTCGTHVHFDCRQLNARQVSTLGQRIALCVPALKQMLPKSRQNNSYCREPINAHRSGNRYTFVNVQSFDKHGTLEVRGHSGTLDGEKISAWIDLMKAIMAVRNSDEITSVFGLINKIPMNEKLAEYIISRAAKFKNVPVNMFGETLSDDDVLDDENAA